MRRPRPAVLGLLFLLLATALPVPATAVPSMLRVVEFASDPATGSREFIEVANFGNSTMDLAGHKLRDQSGNTFTFPTWSLAPGARVVVWGGGNADALGPAWSQSAAWNNAGDTINLLAPDATLLDQVVYGPAPAPLAAPGKGRSWALDGANWTQGEPTPGSAPGAPPANGFTAEVGNVAPSAVLAAPASGTPRATVAVTVEARDGNGDADVASWSLLAGATEVGAGATAGASTVDVTLPASGSLGLRLVVTDKAGMTAEATATVAVSAGLRVELPSGGLGFPTFLPGAAQVTATQGFTVRNDGAAPLRPLLDVSDLRGTGGTLPMAGHLQAGVTVGNATTWVPYAGPLTRLPELAPGEAATVVLRYLDVPAPLAAGKYGATFTVVG